MEDKKTAEKWLETATKGIRFKPDRQAAEGELRGHLEDKLAALRRRYPDMSEEEAEEMALGQMGDAEEIGKELAKIHRPWLGWLWRLSQMVLAGALAALLLLVGMDLKENWEELLRLPGGLRAQLEEVALITGEWELLRQLEEGAETTIGGFTVSVPKGALWREPEGRHVLGLALHISSPRFWEKAWLEREGVSAAPDTLVNTPGGDGGWTLTYRQGREGLFHTESLLLLEDVSPETERVYVRYSYLGQEFALQVRLGEAEAK